MTRRCRVLIQATRLECSNAPLSRPLSHTTLLPPQALSRQLAGEGVLSSRIKVNRSLKEGASLWALRRFTLHAAGRRRTHMRTSEN